MSSSTGLDQYNSCYSSQPRRFSTPPPKWQTSRCSPVMPGSERKPRRSPQAKTDLFHVIHKVPAGDSPYVRAKHVQLIDKDPSRAISLFWAAINTGDRVDSALKDMAVVMKQLDRSDEAIEAIKSFRHLCTPESQESLDNILIELYKQSGRIEEEIEMLQLKLKQLEEGISFGGKRTKMARSQGKKIQITVEKDYSRLLGNLAWAYMQQKDFKSAEEHYRKALSIEADKNKQCNLAMCLMHTNRLTEAKFLLQTIRVSSNDGPMDESHAKSYERASQMLVELETKHVHKFMKQTEHENEFGIARGVVDGNLNKVVHSEACGSGLCFQKYYKYSNGAESSPLSSSFNNMNMGPFTEFPYEKRADFDRRKNHYQFNMVQEGGCEHKRVFDSPFCNGRIPKVPFTQPRRCSLCSNNGDQRKEGGLAEKAHGGFCRKLSFEQSIEGETVQSVENQNLIHFSKTSANVMPKELPQILEEHFPSTGGGDWRKISLGDIERINSETVWTLKNNETNLSVDDSQKKPALDEDGLPSATSISSDCQNDIEISDRDSSQNYNLISACGMTASDDAVEMENHKSIEEHQTGWRKTSELKKSWADMVEEDEIEFKNWRSDCPNNCSSNTFQEYLLSYHTPGKWSGGSMHKEGFSDENLDSNVITETESLLNYTRKLSEKMESIELGCGYFTQTEKSILSKNPSVSQSLSSFAQNQKPGMAGNHCASSPLPLKALNFEGKGLVSSEDLGPTKSIKRRSRLQVFQDITHVPGSPGP